MMLYPKYLACTAFWN